MATPRENGRSPGKTPSSIFDSVEDLAGLLEPTSGDKVRAIPVGQVRPSPFQARTVFEDDALLELGTSLRDKGFVQPLVVREVDGHYELVAGERRFRAAKKVGLKVVPAIVRDLTDEQAEDWGIVENLQRVDLSLADKVAAISRAVKRYGTVKAVAERYGKTVQWVSKLYCLADSPSAVQDFVREGKSADVDGLYDLARLAKKDPGEAKAIMGTYKEGTSLRALVRSTTAGQAEKASTVSGSSADVLATSLSTRDTKKTGGTKAAGEGSRALLVAGVAAKGPDILQLQTASGVVHYHFTAKSLSDLMRAVRGLKAWAPAGSKRSRSDKRAGR